MSLRPLLLIGVGGTGGKVLGATRQYLLRHLNDQGVTELPKAWQTLHIDIPAVRDSEERGLPFSLPASDYLGLMRPESDYVSEHTAVTARLAKESGYRRTLAWDCWAPAPAAQVPGRLAQGAGQLRAVGRAGTLARLEVLNRRLAGVLGIVSNDEHKAELALLSQTLRVDGLPQGKHEVFVVGSICGGSGSGMIGDVLDLLHANGVANPVVIAYTPEVFDGTGAHGDAGLGPNTFLAMSELFNAAWRTDSDEMPISRSVHYKEGGGPNATAKGGPGFLAMVGRSNRHHALRGGPEVFRTTGRMLAGLFLDPQLLTNLINYVDVNGASAGIGTDHTGLRVPDSGIFGAPFTRALGYSTLSVGREFFGDYARHRLLRQCAEQLLDAHLRDADPHVHKTADQLKSEAADRAEATFLAELELNEYGFNPDTGKPNDDVFNAVTIQGTEAGKALLATFGTTVQTAILNCARPGLFGSSIASRDAGQAAGQRVRDVVDKGEANVTLEADRLARANIEAYRKRLSDNVAERIPQSMADRGLPVTIELLARVRNQLLLAAKELESQAEAQTGNARARLADLDAGFGVSRASFRASDHGVVTYYVETAREALASHIRAQEQALSARLCREIIRGLIDPWRRAVERTESALVRQVRPDGPPDQQPINHWPGAEGVPAMYRPSPVEFVLDDVDEFPTDFERIIAKRFPSNVDDERDVARLRRESVEEAVREILTGHQIDPNGPVSVASYAYSWVPDLGGIADPRPATVMLRFDQMDLADRIHRWLRYPQSSTVTYLDTTLGDFLTVQEDPFDHDLKAKRHARMKSAFEGWLRAAEPLMAFNKDLFAATHGAAAPSNTPILGNVPVPNTLGELRQELLGRFLAAFPGAMAPTFDGVDAPGVSAFTFSGPFHPITSTSVMRPLVTGQTPSWEFRRARPLAETVPLTPQARRCLVLGWLAGRLLGETELTGREASTRARVRVDGELVAIPLTGIRPARPSVQYDAPGRVLESLLLALIEAHRTSSLAPLHPYRAMIGLGHECANPSGPINQWVNRGGPLPLTEDRQRLSQDASAESRSQDVQDRVAALRTALNYMNELAEKDRHPHIQWGWSTREIQTDIDWALGHITDAASVADVAPDA